MCSEMLMDDLTADGRDVVDRLLPQGLREPSPDVPGSWHEVPPSATRERSSWTASRVHFVRRVRTWLGARPVEEMGIRSRIAGRWATKGNAGSQGFRVTERTAKRRPKSGWVGSVTSTSSEGASGGLLS